MPGINSRGVGAFLCKKQIGDAKMLETERLILRPVTLDDCDDIYEYSKNPNVGIHAGWKPHESKK